MALTGTLRTWNDERGFGFIAPAHGGAELFVHVSAFPRDGSRPTVGEVVTYELGRGKDDQPQAVRVVRTAVGAADPKRPRRKATSDRGPGLRGVFVALALVVGASVFGLHQYRQNRVANPPVDRAIPGSTGVPGAGRFSCDGRRYCSQMSSCAEAEFFLKNCPGTEMDGDRDGTPCEEQWCH